MATTLTESSVGGYTEDGIRGTSVFLWSSREKGDVLAEKTFFILFYTSLFLCYMDCFPDWLKRRTSQTYGPGIQEPIPYPVSLIQAGIQSQDNPNTNSQNITDSFLQNYVKALPASTIGTTIIHVIPNNMYDTIDIVAIDMGHTVEVPAFLSFDRPGRLNSPATEIIDQIPEVLLCVNAATVTPTFVGGINQFDLSSLPNFISTGTTAAAYYTCLHYQTVKTNRPFYVWFGMSITGGGSFDPAPNPGALIKISWQVMGR
jgi:hypothetical protein